MVTCDYCSDDAIGFDEEERPTCGGSRCALVVRALPRVVEVSDGPDDEEEQPS